MAGIHVYQITKYELNVRLEAALKKKELSEEQLADVFGQLNERKKKQHTSLIVLLVVTAVFLAFLGISFAVTGVSAGYILGFLLIFLAAVGAGGYFGWYFFEGKVAKQWNALLREYYPDVCGKYKL
ncbi:MAG: hypothetical protein IK020_07490 [Clostridiales bacterium]|nr:hypothetical protein [Clostridiales bacterium]